MSDWKEWLQWLWTIDGQTPENENNDSPFSYFRRQVATEQHCKALDARPRVAGTFKPMDLKRVVVALLQVRFYISSTLYPRSSPFATSSTTRFHLPPCFLIDSPLCLFLFSRSIDRPLSSLSSRLCGGDDGQKKFVVHGLFLCFLFVLRIQL